MMVVLVELLYSSSCRHILREIYGVYGEELHRYGMDSTATIFVDCEKLIGSTAKKRQYRSLEFGKHSKAVNYTLSDLQTSFDFHQSGRKAKISRSSSTRDSSSSINVVSAVAFEKKSARQLRASSSAGLLAYITESCLPEVERLEEQVQTLRSQQENTVRDLKSKSEELLGYLAAAQEKLRLLAAAEESSANAKKKKPRGAGKSDTPYTLVTIRNKAQPIANLLIAAMVDLNLSTKDKEKVIASQVQTFIAKHFGVGEDDELMVAAKRDGNRNAKADALIVDAIAEYISHATEFGQGFTNTKHAIETIVTACTTAREKNHTQRCHQIVILQQITTRLPQLLTFLCGFEVVLQRLIIILMVSSSRPHHSCSKAPYFHPKK
jgi:hypothetical protein